MTLNTRTRQLSLLVIVFLTNMNAACLVFDAGLMAKNTILTVLNRQLNGRMSDIERRVYRAGRRIAVLGVDLGRWVINDGILWRTRRVDPALPETIAMMDAYNGVGSAQAGLDALSERVKDAQPLLELLEVVSPDTAAYMRSQLELYEVVRGSNEADIEQTGRIRNNRKSGRDILILSAADLTASIGGTNAVLDLMNVVGMYRTRQGETGNQLTSALLEQEQAQTLIDRDTDTREFNAEISLMQARDMPSIAAGTTDAIRHRRIF